MASAAKTATLRVGAASDLASSHADDGSAKPNQKYGYEQTLMSGHYVTEDLAALAKRIQEERLKQQQILTHRTREEIEKVRRFKQSPCYQCLSGVGGIIMTIVDRVGVDWIFLFLLGCIMALLSFLLDYCIGKLQEAHEVMYEEAASIHPALQVFSWVVYPVVLILFSTYFVHLVAPNAIGSGIPEIKTILRGVILKEYLTFQTLLSKMVGLTTSLGSGLPFGKEGPFVHIACIVATLLSKSVRSFRGIYENESRKSEMLAAAAATGVACTFAAPIGGVLFSIEVTSTYFAVRNYWRGFFSAVIAAILFRLCAIWANEEETVSALYKTTLRHDFPFDARELVAFGIIGFICGVAGAAFVWMHRQFIFLMRSNKKVSSFLQSYRFIYPVIVTLVITSATCPQSLGQYMGGGHTFGRTLSDLFANVTWSDSFNVGHTVEEQNIIKRWDNPNIWISLTVYMVFVFAMSAVAITLPVPSGVFIPVFAIGAAFGRLIGETVWTIWPNGISIGYEVVPAGYAVVGAAALSGAVTHTISTSMIVFELTGQMSHILPAVLAVLIANAIANKLQPSIYDSIIQIKRLPYLPNILPTNSSAHRICAEDIMRREVKMINRDTTYECLRTLLSENENVKTFPLVDSASNMILVGSVQRFELIRLLEEHVSHVRRRRSVSVDTGTEIVNEQNGRKKNGAYKRIKQTNPRKRGSPSGNKRASDSALSDDESDQRKGKGREVLSERLKSHGDNLYLTISAPSHAAPPKSILKKSNSNPDLLSADARPKSMPAPTTSPKGKSPIALSQMFKSRQRSSTEILQRTDSDEQMRWEAEQLKCKLDFPNCHIDPSPFQLVEKTPLTKVHFLFSLLGLHHAYVTNVGRLVGVVSLKELREAISGPSIVGESKPGAIVRKITLTLASTVGGVNLEFDKGDNGPGDKNGAAKT
ncbi:chloride channel protein 2-like isoform X2 [Watersipora subatra]|uniref:chloride channel protein 2-like isoform X2 n=1 Tax=Watersipora subatra TaxID=2589382 RepID=UPI00355BE99F